MKTFAAFVTATLLSAASYAQDNPPNQVPIQVPT